MTSYTLKYTDEKAGTKPRPTLCGCTRPLTATAFPTPRNLSPEETAAHGARFAGQITADQTSLSACLDRFEAIMRKRWLKKSDRGRNEVLLKAFPGIPHGPPDLLGIRSSAKCGCIDTQSYPDIATDALLRPQINLDGLKKAHLLLSFLNSRGRTPPGDFAGPDFNGAFLGEEWRRDGYNGEAFFDLSAEQPYGRLVRDIPEGRVASPWSAKTGLMALEVQTGVYRFLLDCCRVIMHDVPQDRWMDYPCVQSPGEIETRSSQEAWDSVPGLALMSPFQPPAEVDLDRLQAIVEARRTAAEDHIWSLREDPGYFLDAVLTQKAHDVLMPTKSSDRWQDAVCAQLSEAFAMFHKYHALSAILRDIAELRSSRMSDYCSEFLLCEYVAWTSLLSFLAGIIAKRSSYLTNGLLLTMRLSAIFGMPHPDSNPNVWPTHESNHTIAEARLYRLLDALTERDRFGQKQMPWITGEFQHLLDHDREASVTFGSLNLECFADIALTAEMLRRILSGPPCQLRDDNGIDRAQVTDTYWASLHVDTTPWPKDFWLRARTGSSLSSCLGVPTDGRFDYPCDKRRTKENTKQMRHAESQLEKFWQDFGQYSKGRNAEPAFEKFLLYSTRQLPIWKTPGWIEPSNAPKQKPHGHVLRELANLDLNVRPVDDTGNRKRELKDLPTPKKKRRDLQPVGQPEPTNERPQQSTPPPVERYSIRVSSRAHQVFAALFPSGGDRAHVRKQVAWSDLCYAMNGAGLTPAKLYGSVWMFSPMGDAKEKLGRSIQFHEPKDVRRGGKMDHPMVMTIARRLNRAYGWDAQTFVRE